MTNNPKLDIALSLIERNPDKPALQIGYMLVKMGLFEHPQSIYTLIKNSKEQQEALSAFKNHVIVPKALKLHSDQLDYINTLPEDKRHKHMKTVFKGENLGGTLDLMAGDGGKPQMIAVQVLLGHIDTTRNVTPEGE